MLGQNAGENFWPAMIDFTNRSWLTTTNCYRNFSIWKWNAKLASHVHPLFGIFFTVIVYIAIGHLWASHVLQMSLMKWG